VVADRELTIGGERAQLNDKTAASSIVSTRATCISVLGPRGWPSGRFRVTIDGAKAGRPHGSRRRFGWRGVVTAQRLYQLVRDPRGGHDHTFEIRFLDPGVQAYALRLDRADPARNQHAGPAFADSVIQLLGVRDTILDSLTAPDRAPPHIPS